MDKMISIREEIPEDIEAIRKVNEQAFGQTAEADIMDKLRQNCPNLLSLVAVQGEQVVGHILFSPAQIEVETIVKGMGLAPLAVLPEFQRQGFGSRLVRAGRDELKRQGVPFIIVLGHPNYYSRFGFERASSHGIRCQWEGVPEEAFMILILDEETMANISGVGRYRTEFDEVI